MKLVRESLNEMNFERRKDPFGALGIGQEQLIKDWLDEMGVDDYTINDDYTIDVNENINISRRNLKKFPDYIQFDIISGYFLCHENYLVSLKGCPRIVKGKFWCNSNNLVSLDGCPKSVWYFDCSNNKTQFTEEYVRDMCQVFNDVWI